MPCRVNRSGETKFAIKKSPAQLPTSIWPPATRILLVQSLDIVLELAFLLQTTWCCKVMFALSKVLLKCEIVFRRKGGCTPHLETSSHRPWVLGHPWYSTVLLQPLVRLDVVHPARWIFQSGVREAGRVRATESCSILRSLRQPHTSPAVP